MLFEVSNRGECVVMEYGCFRSSNHVSYPRVKSVTSVSQAIEATENHTQNSVFIDRSFRETGITLPTMPICGK